MHSRHWLALGLLGLLVALGVSLLWGLAPRHLTTLHLDDASGGQVVHLQVGQRLDLDLGPGYGPPLSSDAAVLEGQGSQTCGEPLNCRRYHFLAVAPGEVDLASWYRPICQSGEMCSQLIRLSTLHVQVVEHRTWGNVLGWGLG
jgi:hypothetical protein